MAHSVHQFKGIGCTVIAFASVLEIPVTGDVDHATPVILLVVPEPVFASEDLVLLGAITINSGLIVGCAVVAKAVFFVNHTVRDLLHAFIVIQNSVLICAFSVNRFYGSPLNNAIHGSADALSLDKLERVLATIAF